MSSSLYIVEETTQGLILIIEKRQNKALWTDPRLFLPGPPKIRPWSMLWSISKCESIKTTMFWKQLHLIWYLLIQVRHLLMAFLLKQRPLATHSSKQHQNLITCILTHHHHQVIFTIMTHNSWVINSGWYLKLIQIRFTKWSPRRYLSQVW